MYGHVGVEYHDVKLNEIKYTSNEGSIVCSGKNEHKKLERKIPLSYYISCLFP
jgi:hypothetical protein